MSAHRKKRPAHGKKQSGADVKRLFKVLGLSLLIVLLLLAAVHFIARYTDWDLFGAKSQSDVQDGVIYKVDADTVRMMSPYGGGVALLTNSSVLYLDASGREIESNKHIFATPEMRLNDKTVFLYDKGGTGCRLEKNASVYREFTAPGVVTCGAVGKKDNYAFSLDNHEGYQSHIFVYSFKGDKQFEWGSASDYCFRMALSDSGNRLAVCVLGVENAEYYSKVMLFSFNSGQPAYTVKFPGKTVFDIDFISGRKVAVYTDGGVFILDGDGAMTAAQEYASNEIEYACVTPSGLNCTAVMPYGNEQAPQVTVFDASHKKLFTHSYGTLISGITASDNYVGVVMFDKVQIINRSDKVLGDVDVGETCDRSLIVGSNLFILAGSGLHRYNIHFDSKRAETTFSYIPQPNRPKEENTSAVPVSETDAESQVQTTEPVGLTEAGISVVEDAVTDETDEDVSSEPPEEEEEPSGESEEDEYNEDEEETEEPLFG